MLTLWNIMSGKKGCVLLFLIMAKEFELCVQEIEFSK
jgi:hypothetical protein